MVDVQIDGEFHESDINDCDPGPTTSSDSDDEEFDESDCRLEHDDALCESNMDKEVRE